MGVETIALINTRLEKTQGLSDYMHSAFKQPLKAAIAYDCRHNSDTLAKVVADVFSQKALKYSYFRR
jgi:phosphomannomutase